MHRDAYWQRLLLFYDMWHITQQDTNRYSSRWTRGPRGSSDTFAWFALKTDIETIKFVSSHFCEFERMTFLETLLRIELVGISVSKKMQLNIKQYKTVAS